MDDSEYTFTTFLQTVCVVQMRSSREFCVCSTCIFELTHIYINFPVEWNLWHIIIWHDECPVQYHFLCNRWDNYVKYSIYSVYVCIFLFWVHRFGFEQYCNLVSVFISCGNLLDYELKTFHRIMYNIYVRST